MERHSGKRNENLHQQTVGLKDQECLNYNLHMTYVNIESILPNSMCVKATMS